MKLCFFSSVFMRFASTIFQCSFLAKEKHPLNISCHHSFHKTKQTNVELTIKALTFLKVWSHRTVSIFQELKSFGLNNKLLKISHAIGQIPARKWYVLTKAFFYVNGMGGALLRCVPFQPSVIEDCCFFDVTIGLLLACISLPFLVWACEFGEMPVWTLK